MTVPTGTFQAFQAIGNREDLTDAIYNVSPTETPLISMAKKTTAQAALHEWQTESLAAANVNNAVIEGDDAANQTLVTTGRVTNNVQTSEKTIGISTIQEVTRSAGRDSEMAHQMINYGLALRRDMETILLNCVRFRLGMRPTDLLAQVGARGALRPHWRPMVPSAISRKRCSRP
jgi:hypothetical protein